MTFSTGTQLMPNIARISFLLIASLLLTACATAPPSPQNLRAQTDDLGMVTDTALQLAESLGRDEVIVVFDIDNTLLAMEQGLGSDQWYYWQKNQSKIDPCDSRIVADRLAVQGAMFYASAMRATQADVAAQLERLQESGITTIALTSRGPDYRLQTFRELRRQGIRFWPTAIPPRDGYNGTFLPDNGIRPALYEDGVFLTAGQHKGQMMKALLEKTGRPWPKIIILADDKVGNLDDMMETFAGTDTRVHAWRYTREDPAVAAFDPDEAALQWQEIRPALRVLEDVLGPDHFSLPDEKPAQNCEPL